MTEPLSEGDIFAGKYRVERIIGRGAMGMVIAARHLGLDEPVAIKVLLPEMLEVPGMVDRFVREARAAAKIRGDNVVRVSDVDTLPNGAPFMVMERLEGVDLEDLCRSRGPLDLADAARCVREVCAALDAAHALGIVHRDIKPGNLFLAKRRDGTSVVKVLDFGISKLRDGDHAATRTGAVMGSPAYMSPEQLNATKNVDGRTDIWALGIVLYQMVTARLPFAGSTMAELCTNILFNAPVPPGAMRRDLPAAMEAVILRCLEKDPSRRYASAGELSRALAPFETEAARAPIVAGAAPRPATDTVPLAPIPMNRSRAPLFVGLGVVAAGVIGFVALRPPPKTHAAAPQATASASVTPAAAEPAPLPLPPPVQPTATAEVAAPEPPSAAPAKEPSPARPTRPATHTAAPRAEVAPAPRPAPKAPSKDPFQGDRK